MPELPEVEVTMRGIRPLLQDAEICGISHSDKALRAPFDPRLDDLAGARVLAVDRRAKYIHVDTSAGILLLHLGMTGHLRMPDSLTPHEKHDHFDLLLKGGRCIRLNDSRRFGLVKYYPDLAALNAGHEFRDLGPEPLGPDFTAAYLRDTLTRRRIALKTALMDQAVVVGVGNLYASEVLFRCGIDPRRPAHTVKLAECQAIVAEVRQILAHAIELGGTTIINFSDANGHLGYFANELAVYGRDGKPCPRCGQPLQKVVLGGRSTFFCPHCQH